MDAIPFLEHGLSAVTTGQIRLYLQEGVDCGRVAHHFVHEWMTLYVAVASLRQIILDRLLDNLVVIFLPIDLVYRILHLL
ncbi:hypothetical protein FCH28_18575 [Streptomyces piniterrae]|uniref:Uncharacterized protein n=1 Tax=Streptomyces piniterrae TaxID=2571125 RepID=A0A4U0ND13_9ACTN|nr:hypothetical protein FCH28_18575 [Streptomyces piniterrae]